ncbi:MAG: hypothetical protein AAB663_01705, partial [Patescibacteria group bacterium]
MTELAHHGDRGTSENDVAPLKRLRRPKIAPSGLPPGAARPLGDYRKTPLYNGNSTAPHSEIPQPSTDAVLRLPDEELERTVPNRPRDTLAVLRVQMDNLAGQLLQDAPTHIQEEWLVEPTRYRQFVLSVVPSRETKWLDRFLRLVTLDIRAKHLGSLQIE